MPPDDLDVNAAFIVLGALEREADALALTRAQMIIDTLVSAYRLHNTKFGPSQEPAAAPRSFIALIDGVPEHVWVRLAGLLDLTLYRVKSTAAKAWDTVFEAPALHELATEGRLQFHRLEYGAGKAAQIIDAELRSRFDQEAAQLDAGMEWKRWKKAVDDLFLSLQPPADLQENAHKNRHVRCWHNGDGTSCLLFTGPTAVITAAERRNTAWARAIRHPRFLPETPAGQAPLSAGDQITDERTLDRLRFDIGLSGIPELPVAITHSDGSVDEVAVVMRSDDDWLRAQAAVNVTVPFLTLLGDSSLPGRLDDHSPIAAADARRIAGHASHLRRLLTDPADGSVLESPALRYQIPLSLKSTVAARWVWCTVPGCTRKASRTTTDIDHIEPFDRENAARGGPTELFNLHPLCRRHHLLKTEGKFRVESVPAEGMRGSSVRWTFPAALARDLAPPGSAIESTHASECLSLLGSDSGGSDAWPNSINDPPPF